MRAESLAAATSVTLREGSTVTVRQIRPDDKALLSAGFERLSAESRYRRFLTPMPELTKTFLAYLTEVDHHDHEALLALDAHGNGVGVARFVRRDASDVAEAAVTIIDDWQGRGLGTALLNLLADRAREEDVRRFTALMLAANTDMLDLLRGLAPVHVIDREQGTIEVETTLPRRGLGSQLRELLHRLATGEIEARPTLHSRDRAPAAASDQEPATP
jgi:GNAT superfamily N-acetyltransferase